MVGFRERIGKHASPSPRADPTCFADPMFTLSTDSRHGLMDEMGCNHSSLRQRFVQSLKRKRSLPAWHSFEYDLVHDDSHEQQSSSIRKRINFISSSLRGRFSSDASTECETQCRRQSVIRKSFGSMSSSLREIRTSMDSRLSRDAGRRSAAISFEDDCILHSPNLERMVVDMKLEKESAETRSSNTLCTASIFDSPGHLFTVDRRDETTIECGNSAARQPITDAVRFPIRVKRPELGNSKTSGTSGEAQDSCPKAASGLNSPGCSTQTSGNSRNTPQTSKVPEEEHQRQAKFVYVFVPDPEDHSKPWPKKKYPDLKAAVADLCTRFKPYYAPFAVYSSLIRTIQLFPANFTPPAQMTLSVGNIKFTLQEALDNWNSTLFCRSLSEDEEVEDSTYAETNLSMAAQSGSSIMQEHSSRHASNLDGETLDETFTDYLLDSDSDEDFDEETLDSDASFTVEIGPPSNPSQGSLTPSLEWADEPVVIDDDDDSSIASSLEFSL
ncbi:hypothetical protein F5Y05DRAFT_407374 [Hypoxylon sp. FL0543]|nr:hypothetical protein F5Y05DRAFT_407374 [Hypoxylon sp. FL0543]